MPGRQQGGFMKVLILSCHTGGGHDAAAAALAEGFRLLGHTAAVQDFFALRSERAASAASSLYVGTVNRSPQLFHALYQVGSAISSARRHSPVYYVNVWFAPSLEAKLKAERFDLAVTTHIFPAHALTWLKAKGRIQIPAAGVMTDYTCIPFWAETRCEAYVTPHPSLTEEIAGKGLPREALLPLGIPVSPSLGSAPADRQALGMEEGRPLIVLLSGSMGHGDLAPVVDALMQKGGGTPQIAVITGRNEELRKDLSRQYSAVPQVQVKGYEKMGPWLRCCDVLITKPGGLTVTEAAAMRVPLVLSNAIPGCETENQRFFVSRGMALAPDTPAEQAEAALRLCRDAEERDRMRAAQAEAIRPDNAVQICRALAEKFGGMLHA